MKSEDLKYIVIGLACLTTLSVLMIFVPWLVVGAGVMLTIIAASWTIGFIGYNSYMDYKERTAFDDFKKRNNTNKP